MTTDLSEQGEGEWSSAEQLAQTARLNAHYEKLAFELNDGDKGRFLSGWQCVNPYAEELIARVRARTAALDPIGYSYFDDERDLVTKVLDLHERLDAQRPQHAFCGSGATSLLFGFANYLRSLGVKRVYFLPPIYFTFQIALDRFGIRTIPLSESQPFEPGFMFNLPNVKDSVLIITDPVWYVGMPLARHVVSSIAEWQRETSSLVFVDGSLQYLSWSGSKEEATAQLDPSLTFRLVCPSKQVSVHGYRFAYVLVPSKHKQGFAWSYTNMMGPANVASIAFAYEALSALEIGDIPRSLITQVSGTHRRLREKGAISSPFDPQCGYFVFEKINIPLPEKYLLVDGRYFEQASYPEHVKINLLSPSIDLIDN